EKIKDVQRAGEHPDPAAPARPGRFAPGRLLLTEGRAIVGRARDPDQPMIFAVAAAGGERVPRRVDVAGAVGRDRAATVDAVAAPRQVPLRLERGPIGVRPRIEKGRAGLAVRRVHGAAWACRVRAVPCDVDTTAPADRELAPADRPRRDRAAGLAVDAD